MKKLLVYGNSLTAGNGCLSHQPYAKKYKKDSSDIIWPEIVANKLNYQLCNFGIAGASNDVIFDSIIDTFHLIEEGDICIFELTYHHRFDIPNKNSTRLTSMTPNPSNIIQWKNHLKKWLIQKKDNEDNVDQFIHYYIETLTDTDLFKNRYINRLNFLMNIIDKFVKCKSIYWEAENSWNNYETIKEVTSGEINDFHWSFLGHKKFAEFILSQICV